MKSTEGIEKKNAILPEGIFQRKQYYQLGTESHYVQFRVDGLSTSVCRRRSEEVGPKRRNER